MTYSSPPFFLQKENIYAVPIIHYRMEMAAHVKMVFDYIQPDCVAVELAETMELQLLHAASRLPDISIVVSQDKKGENIYYLSEPCDPTFEALRSALESGVKAHCIDLDVESYPEYRERLPDTYSIHRIGLENYYNTYKKLTKKRQLEVCSLDQKRESYMAKRLKELSFSYDKILFVSGMAHLERVLDLVDQQSFPDNKPTARRSVEVCTLTEESCREVMAEFGFISAHYEHLRQLEVKEGIEEASTSLNFPPDRQRLIYQLYKQAAPLYEESTGNEFSNYHLKNTMKFVRNYALATGYLMPDLFQILSAAKGCVDHNYAYEVWLLATEYPHLKNIDNIPELKLSIEEVWGHSKILRFHTKEPARKKERFKKRAKDRSSFRFDPPGPFSICSFPKEDTIIENFGDFLQKKGTQILSEEGARTIPFSASIEDGIDVRETIRHWPEKKLFVKSNGKPLGGVGSVVMIFDEDLPKEEGDPFEEKYPWKTTWLGEHDQESDMGLFATDLTKNVVGPGISRCEYGGFMMTYPPRRVFDIWSDPDYSECRSKAEVLLMAAIDYAKKPIVVYVAEKPPRSQLKSFAKRYGKKVVYIPIGQLSPITINKIRTFHVLDGHDKRRIADEYIY